MPSPHIIRLRGPWEVVGQQSVQHPRQLRLPLSASEEYLTGLDAPITLKRRFHCPTGLEQDQRVFVAIDAVLDVIRVRLNQRDLQDTGDLRFSVGQLLETNLLEITIEHPSGAVPTVDVMLDVRLEIE